MNENQNLSQNTSQMQNNNLQNNSINNIVPPISEVKIESEAPININYENNQSQLPTNNLTPNEPHKNNKISNVLLILLFIFLFAFVMGMPYINEFVNKLKSDNDLSEIEKEAKEEEERQKQEENNKTSSTKEEDKTIELVCTSNTNTTSNYALVQTQKFNYNSNNEVLSSKFISHYTFTIEDETYNELKKQCEEDSLKYITHSGYTIACSYNDVNIEINHEFDLETFTPIVDGTTNIQANATYKQDITTIKNTLISQGYTCK